MTRDDMTERLDETVRQAPQPQGGNRREGLLEGLSMSQVVATALAAVTSMLLSSQIGIAGSIIGVAAASVVSTVAAQVYKGVLSRSADKLRELRDTASAGDAGAADVTNPYAAQGSTPWDEMAAGAGEPVMGTPGAAAPSPAERARIAPEGLREEAAERRQARLRKRVAVATLVAGLAAVAVTAGVIMLATHGEGIGTKPAAPAATAATTKAATTAKATTNAAETAKAAGGQGSAASAPAARSEASAGSGSSEQAEGSSAATAEASTAGAAGSGSGSSSSSKDEGASGSGSGTSTTGSAGSGSASGSGASAGGSSSGSGDTAR